MEIGYVWSACVLGAVAIWGISKTHPKLTLCWIVAYNLFYSCQVTLKFVQTTEVSSSYSTQNIKTTWPRKRISWKNNTSWYFSLRWGSSGLPFITAARWICYRNHDFSSSPWNGFLKLQIFAERNPFVEKLLFDLILQTLYQQYFICEICDTQVLTSKGKHLMLPWVFIQ